MTDQDEKTTENPEDTAENTAEAVETEQDTAPVTVDDAVDRAYQELSADETTETEDTSAEKAPDTSVEAPAEEIAAPEKPATPEWWGDDAGTWEALPREARDRLEAREKERTEAIERSAMPEGVGSWIDQVRDMSAAYGLTVEQGMERLVTAQRTLLANPTHGLSQLARQLGIDPSQLAALSDQGQTQTDADPALAVQEIVRRELGNYQAQQAEQQTQKALHDLDEWSKEKGEDGKPLRPYFEDLQGFVKVEMDRLLAENPHQDRWGVLDKAYNAVARLKAPDVDVTALAEKKAQELYEAKQAEARKASAAAISPASSASGVVTDISDKPKSVDDAVDRAWDDLQRAEAARI